jgi:DNA-binding transcriptional MerR regulator
LERLLRPGRVSAALGVSRETLRTWEVTGKFPADQRTHGGHRRWLESRVRAFAASLRLKPAGPATA